MMKSRREWKLYARRALQGNYAVLIGANILLAALSMIGSWLTGWLFPSMSARDIVLSEIFAFILTLVICVFSAGLYYMMLNIARGREFSFGNLIYFFQHEPDRVIKASFVLALIGWITALPSSIYAYTAQVSTLEEEIAYLATYSMLSLLGLVLNFLLTVPFTLVYYLLADEEQMDGFETLKESLRLMKGNIGKYILMELSFLPLMFLSVFTLYLALLWLVPYMEMTAVMFYRDIRGELDSQPERIREVVRYEEPEEASPSVIYLPQAEASDGEETPGEEAPSSLEIPPEENFTAGETPNLSGDDFNSEA